MGHSQERKPSSALVRNRFQVFLLPDPLPVRDVLKDYTYLTSPNEVGGGFAFWRLVDAK